MNPWADGSFILNTRRKDRHAMAQHANAQGFDGLSPPP